MLLLPRYMPLLPPRYVLLPPPRYMLLPPPRYVLLLPPRCGAASRRAQTVATTAAVAEGVVAAPEVERMVVVRAKESPTAEGPLERRRRRRRRAVSEGSGGGIG